MKSLIYLEAAAMLLITAYFLPLLWPEEYRAIAISFFSLAALTFAGMLARAIVARFIASIWFGIAGCLLIMMGMTYLASIPDEPLGNTIAQSLAAGIRRAGWICLLIGPMYLFLMFRLQFGGRERQHYSKRLRG